MTAAPEPGSPAGVATALSRALTNMAAKGGSLVVEKASQAALVIVAARVLGVASFGRYSLAASVTTLLAFGTDLGLTLWTTRALAREPGRAPEVLGTALHLRLYATAPVLIAIAVAALIVGPGEARFAMGPLGVAALARAFLDHARAVFRAHERLGDEGKVNTATALLMTAGGLGALVASGRGLPALALGVMAGALGGAAYGFALLGRRYGRWSGRFDAALARRVLREALPFWAAGVFSLVYSRGDVVVLRGFASDAEVGAYRAAGQLYDLAKNVPVLVMTALFPQLARDFRQSRPRLRRVEGIVAAGLLVAGIATAAVLAGAAGPIAHRVLGPGFARTIPSLRILSLALPVLFVNAALTHFLVARDLGVLNLILAGLMVAVNLGANLLLAPRAGAAGTAWAAFVTEAALGACCLVALRAARRRDLAAPAGATAQATPAPTA
jgi:O-antigen/teichoic acid export membrane protein